MTSHPGGQDKIKLAAGGAVEPFWRIYQQHYESKLPLEILEKLRIGTLHPDDVLSNEQSKDDSDPYKNDPPSNPLLKYTQLKPLCGKS